MEYWDDYTEYDTVADELKTALIGSMRADIKQKIEKLESENKELRAKLQNLSELEKEAEDILRQAKAKYESAERDAKYAKATELFKYLEETKYQVTLESVERPKCDKCNDNRSLEFVYPSGKPGFERCDCSELDYHHIVVPAIGTSVDIRNGELLVWYRPYSSNDDYSSMSGTIEQLYQGEDFADLKDSRSLLFADKTQAELYAAYLDDKKASKQGDSDAQSKM